jgi:hypothetical protein
MQYATTHKAVRNYKLEAVYKVYLVFGFVAIAEEIYQLGSEVVVQKQTTYMRAPFAQIKITIMEIV